VGTRRVLAPAGQADAAKLSLVTMRSSATHSTIPMEPIDRTRLLEPRPSVRCTHAMMGTLIYELATSACEMALGTALLLT
jgi:hypothetical protein